VGTNEQSGAIDVKLNPIDESQRRAARVAGVALLFATATVMVANYRISFRLSVPGNAIETARNIMAHETLFRLNIACDLLYAATLVVLLAALDVTLRPVSRGLALVAAACRLVVVVMWCVAALDMLGALRLLGTDGYLAVLGADPLKALAKVQLAGGYDAYYVGLPFWGLASTVCSYLWLKSRSVPRSLAALGLISSAWCVISALAFLVFPDFDKTVDAYWFDSPMVLFEVALGLRLLVSGLRPSGTGESRGGEQLSAPA
jgi:hypothetical protein